MISLKDIARECGVSTATVSKALNNQNDIGDNTKQKVKFIAKEMGYLPNSAARALKTNRSFNIGVLFIEEAGSGLLHEYFSGVLNGFKIQAEMQGFDITFINNWVENQPRSYYEHCRYRNFEGIIIVCADYNAPNVQELLDSTIPIVTIDYIHQNCTAVCSNNVKGIETLCRYIVEMGHKRIAYIHGQKCSYVTKERLASFYGIMEELGITIPHEYVREGLYLEPKKSDIITKELLSLKNPPTCIIYPDDRALIGGRNAILDAGLKIPEDISIAGYDGCIMSQVLYPSVATILQDTNEIGREAARRLINAMVNPKTNLIKRVVIDGILIKGESVGQPKE